MTVATITSETVIKRAESIMASSVGTEMVMMDIDAGKYYGFNVVGTSIWNLLEQPCSIQTLCDQLLQKFDIDAETCEQEVMRFVNQLLEFKAIEIS